MLNPTRLAELELDVRHRHGERWARMEQEHTAATHDPELAWGNGRIYRCHECDETYLVAVPAARGMDAAHE